MKIAVWLAALLPSLAARVLAALGFSILTVTGIAVAFDSVSSLLISNLQAMPAAVVQLAGLAGVGLGVSFIFGAITFRVVYFQLVAGARMVLK